VSWNFSTIFDKMCHRQVTLDLATQRRPKTLPVVLSVQEVQRLLEATPTLRDILLPGLRHAMGMRVSEVICLRRRGVDVDRWLLPSPPVPREGGSKGSPVLATPGTRVTVSERKRPIRFAPLW